MEVTVMRLPAMTLSKSLVPLTSRKALLQKRVGRLQQFNLGLVKQVRADCQQQKTRNDQTRHGEEPHERTPDRFRQLSEPVCFHQFSRSVVFRKTFDNSRR